MRFDVFLRVAVACALAFFAPACVAFAPDVDEPLRVETVRDLTPEALHLVQGQTPLAEVRARMTAAGVTGIVNDASATGVTGGPKARIEALAGDYQRRVHLFVDDRYRTSLLLPTHGVPPYGLAMRLGNAAGRDVLVVLYRDPLARDVVPPTLLAFDVTTVDAPRLVARRPLTAETREHDGMSLPLLVGADFDEGVMLVARDRDGTLWSDGYLLRLVASGIDVERRSIGEALRCSCVRAYAVGRHDVH